MLHLTLLLLLRSLSFSSGKMNLEKISLSILQCICCGLNSSLVYCFLDWFQFYLPLFYIIYGNEYMTKEHKN